MPDKRSHTTREQRLCLLYDLHRAANNTGDVTGSVALQVYKITAVILIGGASVPLPRSSRLLRSLRALFIANHMIWEYIRQPQE